jgi:hypothetical protein
MDQDHQQTISYGPFDNIEGAHQYLTLLMEALTDAQATITDDTAEMLDDGESRRVKALRLVSYKLSQLKQHLETSRRLLNDLRTLRRLLQDERETTRQLVNASGSSAYP